MKNKLINFLKKYWLVIAPLLISLVMFYPALTSFFTHDDFYFLKISKVDSVSSFVSFFDPIHDSQSIGVYRPLPLRVYYFLGTSVFNLNPLGLRVISFITFFVDILLVGYLAKLLTKNNRIAAISIFLYAVSVTHFGQLYYVGAYQELLITFLTLTSVIFFSKSKTLPSFIFFVLALMCKETAVVIPGLFVLVYAYQVVTKSTKIKFKSFIMRMIPFVLLIALYLYLHFFHFGTIEGDSYIWDFSPTRALNTLVWYFLWSLNIPEMLIDFVGPGIHLNPNLMKYWASQIIPIFILFAIQILLMVVALIKSFKSKFSETESVIMFSALWFIATILPVIFLPLHKFTYYLTLPLIGVVFLLAFIFHKSKLLIPFCLVWLATSIFSLNLTKETNWITKGVETSKRVYTYFKLNKDSIGSNTISFVDTAEDNKLPWSPTETLKTVISDKNFFDMYFPSLASKISYGGDGEVKVNSRQFLGY